jgi:tetratricopeptide (TPR) repeat protein
MKFKSLLVVALAAAVPALACAKKPTKVADEKPVQEAVVDEADPVITEECVMNVSLFHESVKNKMYADAYNPWWEVYSTCPNANKSVYTDGAKIVEALFQATSDPAEKERLAKLAIEMQDKRIRFFGNDPKYPKDYILGEKGLAYVDFYGEAKLAEARQCLRTSAEAMGPRSKISVLKTLMDVSYALYKQDRDANAEQLISDYELASNLLAEQAADPNNKNGEIAAKQKDYVDNIFAISGAADCSKLDELYFDDVRDNVNNLEVLAKIIKLYKRVRCTESDIYFSACEAAHKLQPTDESAAGCASMAAKKGDYEQAVAYYDQAIKLAMVEDELEDVADYQYNAAVYCFANLKRYQDARKYALASISTLSGLGINKGQGRCYIIIGMCYASSRPYGNDAKGAILNKTVYWAAVDKFVKAKQVDPSVEATANEYISSYSRYYPTKEERFDLPGEFSGSTFHVGGWIGETTAIR